MKKADIGLIGLAVMGENLVMNMESKGFTVAVFNRTTEKVKKFVEGRAKGKNIIGTYSLQELADSLAKPRKVMIMVKAGQPVDDFIDMLNPGGRVCIITFHSLEDRIVKSGFKKNENPCTCPPEFPVCVCGKVSKGKVISTKPILPTSKEIEQNKRSKSAKLRVFERK